MGFRRSAGQVRQPKPGMTRFRWPFSLVQFRAPGEGTAHPSETPMFHKVEVSVKKEAHHCDESQALRQPDRRSCRAASKRFNRYLDIPVAEARIPTHLHPRSDACAARPSNGGLRLHLTIRSGPRGSRPGSAGSFLSNPSSMTGSRVSYIQLPRKECRLALVALLTCGGIFA